MAEAKLSSQSTTLDCNSLSGQFAWQGSIQMMGWGSKHRTAFTNTLVLIAMNLKVSRCFTIISVSSYKCLLYVENYNGCKAEGLRLGKNAIAPLAV